MSELSNTSVEFLVRLVQKKNSMYHQSVQDGCLYTGIYRYIG